MSIVNLSYMQDSSFAGDIRGCVWYSWIKILNLFITFHWRFIEVRLYLFFILF
jgi:hypothetical protein